MLLLKPSVLTNQKIPPIREPQWAPNEHWAPPTPMKHRKWCNRALKTLKYLNICAYFSINLKYFVSIHTINKFKWIVLYFSIVFNLIMSFTMLHGIVVVSLIKVVKHTVLYLCLFDWFSKYLLLQIKVCTVVILLLADWFGSWLIAL